MQHAIKKEYSNSAATVTWEPQKMHSLSICKKGLPNVFKPAQRPWIQMGDVNSEAIVEQVKKCPSGALGFYYNKQ